jgi:hypothetical protein
MSLPPVGAAALEVPQVIDFSAAYGLASIAHFRIGSPA